MASFKKFKVLVLAGPTWMPIDRVRVITNIFSGELGLLIAREFYRQGAEVTLLFGPGQRGLINKKQDRFKIIFFDYFSELLKLAKKHAHKKGVIVNSAAIADYQPIKSFSGKIKSGQKDFCLYFKPTPKIIDVIKKINPRAVLVKFKLEVGKSKQQLLDIAYKSLLASQADFIVANDLSKIQKAGYQSFIMDKNKRVANCYTKNQTAKKLVKLCLSRGHCG